MDYETDSNHSICFIDLTDETDDDCIQESFVDIIDLCETDDEMQTPQINQENKPINKKKKRRTRKSENPGTTQTRSAFQFYLKGLKQRGTFVSKEASITSWNILKTNNPEKVLLYDQMSLTDRIRFDRATNFRDFRKQREQKARIKRLDCKSKVSARFNVMR